MKNPRTGRFCCDRAAINTGIPGEKYTRRGPSTNSKRGAVPPEAEIDVTEMRRTEWEDNKKF